MVWLTELSIRRPKTVVLIYALLVVLFSVGVQRLQTEEDLRVFFPTDDPDVKVFKQVANTFGALRVAIIGVETSPGTDVFAPEVMKKIATTTTTMRNLRGVDRVVSMTSVADVTSTAEGAEVRPLVDKPPATVEEVRALRDKVMARDHLVGNVVSRDGRAAQLTVFITEGVTDREATAGLRAVAEKELAGLNIFYGGAPFDGQAIYQEAQEDVRKLSPVALLILLLVVILSFRDPIGVALTVASVAFSALVVVGAMGFLGEKYTVATSTLPVILFASGNSYAVHVLGRYYLLQQEGKKLSDAIREALGITTPPVAICALTTSAGFFSFLVTDVRPMKAFGVVCGAGVLICLVTAFTLVPAIVSLWPRPASPSAQLARVGDWMVSLWSLARRWRVVVLVAAAVTGALCLGPMRRVRVRMDPVAFFRDGSEPMRARHFLDERFGGSTFVQVALHGDFDDPATLREMARLVDYTRSLPGVTQVVHIGEYLRLVSDAMGAGRRLPASLPQATNLYFFLQGEAEIKALLHPDRKDALVNIRARGDSEKVAEQLEEFVKRELRAKPEMPIANEVAQRILWIAKGQGIDLNPEFVKQLAREAKLPDEWFEERKQVVREFLKSNEAPILDAAKQAQLADDPAVGDKLVALAPSPDEGEIAKMALESRLAVTRIDLAVARLLEKLKATAPGWKDTNPVRDALHDLFVTPGPPAAREPLSGAVAGEPIFFRGFSRSVGRNLDRSLVVSIVIVTLLIFSLLRSTRQAVIAMLPSLLTLGIMFGVMGMLGISIDLGTSLVAGIATGAGSDFALQYLWYLRRQRSNEVTRSVGPILAISILLVSAGFAVLTLGKSPVMHLFGTLAAVAMSLSALLTCLMLPALLNKVDALMDSAPPPSKSREGSQ